MRYGIASAMATIAVLLTAIIGPGWFAKNTLYDTDTVVARVDTTLDDERVQLAIADNVVDELFLLAGIDRTEAVEAIDEEAEADEDESDEGESEGEDEGADDAAGGAVGEDPADPDGAVTADPDDDEGLLADLPIAEALQTVATERAVAILASDRLDPAILAATRSSHEEFLRIVDDDPAGSTGEITIDLEPVVDATIEALADDPLLGFLATSDADIGNADFVVATEGQGGGVWWSMVRSFPDWVNTALLATILLLGGAIVLSPERDRIMLSSGVAIAIIALVIAAAAWAARAVVATVFIRDEVSRGAFEAIYGTLSRPLIGLEIRVAVFGAILAGIGGVLGFILDWQAERAMAAAPEHPHGYDPHQPGYQSPYQNTGIPPGPPR